MNPAYIGMFLGLVLGIILAGSVALFCVFQDIQKRRAEAKDREIEELKEKLAARDSAVPISGPGLAMTAKQANTQENKIPQYTSWRDFKRDSGQV